MNTRWTIKIEKSGSKYIVTVYPGPQRGAAIHVTITCDTMTEAAAAAVAFEEV